MPHVSEEQLSAYIDHQMDADESLALEAHLRDCAECRAILDEMMEITRLFQETEQVAPSPFLWNRIAADLCHEEQTPARRWAAAVLAGLRAHSRSLGTAAAALALFFAVGITIFHNNARQAAEQAALAAIDQTHRSLAAQDPDVYNPFSSGSLGDLDANPFTTLRLSGRTVPGN